MFHQPKNIHEHSEGLGDVSLYPMMGIYLITQILCVTFDLFASYRSSFGLGSRFLSMQFPSGTSITFSLIRSGGCRNRDPRGNTE